MPSDGLIYEMREYLVSDGRAGDEIARARSTILGVAEGGTGLFDRHSLPRPWAIWRGLHGRSLPSIAFLYTWPSMSLRSKAFTGLYVDPIWIELRSQTNGSHEIVSRIDDLIFTGPPHHEPPSGSGIYEFVRESGTATILRAGEIALLPLAGDDVRPLVIRNLGDDLATALTPTRAGRGKLFQLLEL